MLLRMRKITLRPALIGLFVIVLAAVVLHVGLALAHWPQTDSDEGTIDLMALHILTRGEHPIFYYGQAYMGPLQAYLGAFFIHVFGVSIFSVRLGLILLYALYLLCMYALTSRLFSVPFALVTVVLLSIGSSTVLGQHLFANGGYSEIMFFGALIFLLVVHLVYTASRDQPSHVQAWPARRLWLYGLLGLVMGIAFWSDFLVAPAIATAGLFLLIFCWRELRGWAGISLIVGIVLGLFPVILYNLSVPPASNSWHAVLITTGYTSSGSISYLQRIVQTFLISLPLETGVQPTCVLHEPMVPVHTLLQLFPSDQAASCLVTHGGWGLGVVVLWSLSVVLAGRTLWRWRGKTWKDVAVMPWPGIQAAAQLMLLTSAALTVVLFAVSGRAATSPHSADRYLVCVFWALPAVLWPLWHGWGRTFSLAEGEAKKRMTQPQAAAFWIRMAVLLLIGVVFLKGTIDIWVDDVPVAQAAYREQGVLVDRLLYYRATRIYSDYWTCGVLMFRSDERILCSNFSDRPGPVSDRYPLYHTLVLASPSVAYVFHLHSLQDNAILHGRYHLARSYHRFVIGNYALYQRTTRA